MKNLDTIIFFIKNKERYNIFSCH